ncbi:MAG: type II toxin-antitoxin system HicA family toxin [Candidatus Omnitrophota bacterium]
MTPKPPLISGNEAIKAFKHAGYNVISQKGSHVKLYNPITEITIIIPNHKEIDRWTLKSILKDSGISIEEFMNLI